MPLNLANTDDDNILNVQDDISPKLFSDELTGNNKARGLLNKNTGPGFPPDDNIVALMDQMYPRGLYSRDKKSIKNVTTFLLPLAMTISDLYRDGLTVDTPELDRCFKMTTATLNTIECDIYLHVTSQSLWLRKEDDPTGPGNVRSLAVCYQMTLFAVNANQPEDRITLTTNKITSGTGLRKFSWNVPQTLSDMVKDIKLKQSISVAADDPDALTTWLEEFSLYEDITEKAKLWFESGGTREITGWIEQSFDVSDAEPDRDRFELLVNQLIYLENYNLPLDEYQNIYQSLESHLNPDYLKVAVKYNMSLSMSSTLSRINEIKDQLPVPNPKSSGTIPQRASIQQRKAIATNEPLVLTQAGAGTGKSSVIISRIDNLISRGVDPSDILVLSFTNAAANNIKKRNPNIGSKTIASMIHDIYHKNYPSHELSTTETLINVLKIRFGDTPFINRFSDLMMEIESNTPGSYTRLNSFVEYNFDGVIAALDQANQTTLILEIIICYQNIDKMVEPKELIAKYLIIDEVQDNSIFEFIYLICYGIKHKMNIFMVGDSSQVLYEFRNANPKALNTLEKSGVFTTYQLTTNYRSNQEILDFANVALRDIKANRYAQIQLQANNLILPTHESFTQKVTLDHRSVRTFQEMDEKKLQGIIRVTARPWIEERIAKGEQVAFLAPTRRQVKSIQAQLETMYPDKKVVSLVSDRMYPSTLITNFIKLFWSHVEAMPPKDAGMVIYREMTANVDSLMRKGQKREKTLSQMNKLIQNWWIANKGYIDGWLNLLSNNQISEADFFSYVKQSLTNHEVRANAMLQSVISSRNEERKRQQEDGTPADLVVSTVHGAKGLEFPHVFILYKDSGAIQKEDAKRMYYVAFTRAMDSEYILSYGKDKNPRIVNDYETLAESIKERDKQMADDDAQNGNIFNKPSDD